MKIRRFIAAFVSAAMVTTSWSFPVAAGELDTGSEAVIGTVEEEETGSIESYVDLTEQDGTEENSILDTEDVLSENEAAPDEASAYGIIGEDADVAPESGEKASLCFETFKNAQGLQELRVKDGYSLDNFGVTAIIPKETQYIPKSLDLFWRNQKLTSIAFEPGGTGSLQIEAGAFMDSKIASFISPNNLYKINEDTFNGCSSLTSFDFVNIADIGDRAFEGCTLLGKTSTGKIGYVENIGDYAFKNTGFVSLSLENLINTNADSVTLGAYAFAGCTGLTSVFVPKNVNVIPDHCFADCRSLTKISVTAATGGTAIGDFAFSNCVSLAQISGSETEGFDLNISELGASAFSGCYNLKTAVFPKTLTKVGSRAFDGCRTLTKVTFYYRNEETGFADDNLVIDDNAFPSELYKKVTLAGYDGTLKDYALNSNHVFKGFESLFKEFTIGATSGFKSGFNFKTNMPGNKAKPGTIVRVTLTNNTSHDRTFRLQRGTMYDQNGGLEKKDFTLISGNDTNQVFEFKMPYKNVMLHADPVFYEDKDLKDCKLTSDIAVYRTGESRKFIPGANDYYQTMSPGYRGRLQINASNGSKSYSLGEWMFTYEVGDNKILKVSETGVISTLATGETYILAKYRTDSTKAIKITVSVGSPVKITSMNITTADGERPISYYVTRREDDGNDYEEPVIEIPQSLMNTTDLFIKLRLNAYAEEGTESYYISADWWNYNSNIVTLTSTPVNKNTDNEMIIKVNKANAGDAKIRVLHNTGRTNEKGEAILLYAYIIIRVADLTPRISPADVYVDVNRDDKETGGTVVKIQPYGDYDIDEEYGLSIWKDEDNAYNGLLIREDGNNEYRFIATGMELGLTTPGAKHVYSGKTKLFIRGRYNSGDEFTIPITKLTVENRKMELKIKPAGALNLFYNSSCYTPLLIPGFETELEPKDNETAEDYTERYINYTVSQISVVNNIPKSMAEVDHAQLWTDKRYKEWKSDKTKKWPDDDTDDNLSNNFTVAKDRINPQNLIIRRSSNMLKTENRNGKQYPIVDGYLAVYFKGYTKPLIQSVKIPYKIAAPSYTVTPSTVTDNKLNREGTYRFKIMNNRTKKVVISEDSLASVELVRTSYFKNIACSGDLFTLESTKNEGRKTAYVIVRRKNWDDTASVHYSYSVNYVDSAPVAKLSPTTAKLNTAFADADIPTTLTLELSEVNCDLTFDDDVEGTGETFVFTGKSELKSEADKMKITPLDDPDGAPNKKIINITLDDTPAPGKYSFAFIPQYNYKDSTRIIPLRKMSFTVNVYNNNPVLKLTNPNYTFNMYFPEKELWESVVTFTDLPSEIKLEDINDLLDLESAEFVLASKDPAKTDPYGISDDIRKGITIDKRYDSIKKKQYLMFRADLSKIPDTVSKFSFTYYLNGITVKDIPIKENALKVTIKGTTAEAKVTVSASGTINTIDYTTNVKYTAKFRGLNNPTIEEMKIIDNDTGDESEDFYAVRDDKDASAFHIYAKHNNDEELSNEKHSFTLHYNIMDDEAIDPETSLLSIKPVQKVPVLTANVAKAVYFSGISDDIRVVEIELTKASELKTHITDIKFAAGTSGYLKNAFEIEYIDEDEGAHEYTDVTKYDKTYKAGKIVLKCTNPENFVGKEFKILLETEFDGQFYKRDRYGNLVLDDNDNPIKIGGSVLTLPVAIYP